MSIYPKNLSEADVSRVIMMAWEDRTSFDAMRVQFGLTPGEVIKLMRRNLKPQSFKLWRRRTQGRWTKHEALCNQRIPGTLRRFRAEGQRG